MDSRLMVALFFALDKKGGYDKMKITDYEKVRQLDESNIVLIDGNNGTKTILVSDFAKAQTFFLLTNDISCECIFVRCHEEPDSIAYHISP